MKNVLSRTWKSFGSLYLCALVIAFVARVGYAVMDATGIATYDYIAASTGTLLNQICSALTGPTLIAFIVLGGIILCLSLSAVLLYGYHYSRGGEDLTSVGPALVYGFATTLVSLVCLAIFGGGIFSAVQQSSMKTKLAIDGGVMLMALLFVCAITTLLAAAMLVLVRCIKYGKEKGHFGRRCVIACLVNGIIVAALTIPTFASINVPKLDGMACALWFGIDTVVNLVILFVAHARLGGSSK